MASGSASSVSAPHRRGLFSCLHSLNCRAVEDAPLLSDKGLREAIHKIIVGYYDEAYARLREPCKTMPGLFDHLSTGTFCLGLLDPVSNIIINTLALLPKDADAAAATASSSSAPPAAKRSKSTRTRAGFDPWFQVAIRSYQSLKCFLLAYFRCLTEEQATRYVYRADANLLLAVMLVHHDLYVEEGKEALDPADSRRTHAAIESAATTVGHPSPTTLARVMAIKLRKDGDFQLLKNKLSARAPLTADDARAIHSILHLMMSPPCVAAISHDQDGTMVMHYRPNLDTAWFTTSPVTEDTKTISTALRWDGAPISTLQSRLELDSKLQDCLRIADGQKHILKTPCSVVDACDYQETLRMYLLAVIHNLYVKAFKLLPTPTGSLLRSILKAGHCYGSCDHPLSNIIINAIWYDTCGSSLPVSYREEVAQYNDILDPLSLLRPMVGSLEGLVKLAMLAEPQSSVACAMEKLCSAKCVHDDMLPPASDMSEKNPFHEAAMAAGHPRPLQLGELHRLLLLMPDQRTKLLFFITTAQTSGTVLPVDDIASILDTVFSRSKAPEPVLVQAPQLCEEASKVVSSKRLGYEEYRRSIRSKIEQMLKDYTDKHFWGPNYKLDVIIGVDETNYGSYPFIDSRYHVNFMASSDPKLQRTLFYAEFGHSPEQEPEFCCPLPYAYAGRCYYGPLSARKIVYPDDAKYFELDITKDGTRAVGGLLGMDMIYFNSELDVKVAEQLNSLDYREAGSESDGDGEFGEF